MINEKILEKGAQMQHTNTESDYVLFQRSAIPFLLSHALMSLDNEAPPV
jgi:hypothetical protein